MFEVLTRRPLGLAFDIDGTLSPIAPTPDAARLYPGIADLLEKARAKREVSVAIMTGRSIESGAALVQVEGLTYIGSHGLEWSDGLPSTHAVHVRPDALAYAEAGKTLLDLAERRLQGYPGVVIERKRVGGALHYRLCERPEQVRQIILDLLAEPVRQAQMALIEGKSVVEIKTALPIHKGQALRQFVERYNLQGVLFAGDDRTDLDAMREIAQLREEGVTAYAVAVQAKDTFPALLEQADLVVQGVPGMAKLLGQIVNDLLQD